MVADSVDSNVLRQLLRDLNLGGIQRPSSPSTIHKSTSIKISDDSKMEHLGDTDDDHEVTSSQRPWSVGTGFHETEKEKKTNEMTWTIQGEKENYEYSLEIIDLAASSSSDSEDDFEDASSRLETDGQQHQQDAQERGIRLQEMWGEEKSPETDIVPASAIRGTPGHRKFVIVSDSDDEDGYERKDSLGSESGTKVVLLGDSDGGSDEETNTAPILPVFEDILGKTPRKYDLENKVKAIDRGTMNHHMMYMPPRSTLDALLQSPITKASTRIDMNATFTPHGNNAAKKKSFLKQRDELARRLYVKYNDLVFGSQLPVELDIAWNKRLATTAGLTHYKRTHVSNNPSSCRELKYSARIELSCKVIDTEDKLERTLVHEMCHVAAWLIDHTAKPPHGPAFKAWAARAMKAAPHLDVTTCHQYEIHFPFRWQCSGCDQLYQRHSNSIDINKKVCGRCRSQLVFLGKFTRDGQLVPSRKPTAFSLFVKTKFAEVKQECPKGTSAAEIMKILSREWTNSEARKAAQKVQSENKSGSSLQPSPGRGKGRAIEEHRVNSESEDKRYDGETRESEEILIKVMRMRL